MRFVSPIQDHLCSKLCCPPRDLRALLIAAGFSELRSILLIPHVEAPAEKRPLNVTTRGAAELLLEPTAKFPSKVHPSRIPLGGGSVLEAFPAKDLTGFYESPARAVAALKLSRFLSLRQP